MRGLNCSRCGHTLEEEAPELHIMLDGERTPAEGFEGEDEPQNKGFTCFGQPLKT